MLSQKLELYNNTALVVENNHIYEQPTSSSVWIDSYNENVTYNHVIIE